MTGIANAKRLTETYRYFSVNEYATHEGGIWRSRRTVNVNPIKYLVFGYYYFSWFESSALRMPNSHWCSRHDFLKVLEVRILDSTGSWTKSMNSFGTCSRFKQWKCKNTLKSHRIMGSFRWDNRNVVIILHVQACSYIHKSIAKGYIELQITSIHSGAITIR